MGFHMKTFCALLGTIALATGTLLAAPAHAVGRLVDVNLIDRDSGARLPVYRHDGQWWVAGRPGARYAVELRNTTGAHVLGVMSVDGVNVISGETAGWDQSGYVLNSGQRAPITGWRKSDAEVAAFHFTALPLSYAARTGRPDHVGVIGVAVFRERLPVPPPVPAPTPRPMEQRESPAAGESAAGPAARQSRAADAAAEPEHAARARREAPAAAPRLGTGHGERESAWVTQTLFQRRGAQPDELIAIRYDSHENLLALGVIPRDPRRTPAPLPFPDAPPGRGYTPDPPAWR